MHTGQIHRSSVVQASFTPVETPSLVKAAGVKPERNDTIELLRILSACGIIWFHMETTPWKRVGYAGLVFFLVIGVVFQQQSSQRSLWKDYLLKRANRLLVPWAAWFLLYGILNLVRSRPFYPSELGIPGGILAGPWIGLWFLPFCFAAACCVFAISLLFAQVAPRLQFLIFSMVSMVVFLAVCGMRVQVALPAPWAQWLQALPSIPIGLAFACSLTANPPSNLMVIAFEAALLAACGASYGSDPGMAISYGIGSLLAIVGLLCPATLSPLVGKASALCLGVYLIHGAVISGFKFFPWLMYHYFVWFLATALVSFVVVAAMRRVPVLRWIF